MSTYIFILGKDSRLSKAELSSVYQKSLFQADSFVMVQSDKSLDKKSFDRLGGQIKVGELFNRLNKKDLVVSIADHLSSSHSSGKLNYALSVYGFSEKMLRLLVLDVKKALKKRGIGSRFANQNFLNLSTAQHKGLRGKEILICKMGDLYALAEVLYVQDIDAYSERDFEKPFRDMKVGMLPPKLAQIMLNLSGISSGKIWDPFCGGGVLVMEGILMGYSMLGSDINGNTLEGAKRNVDWVRRYFSSSASVDLFVHDATQSLPDKTFDAIVFEGYLGAPQSHLKSKKEFNKTLEDLTQLYYDFFSQLKSSKFKGPIVAGFPFYKVKEGELFLDSLLVKIDKLGFKKDLDLKYIRTNQWVGRHILRFRLA